MSRVVRSLPIAAFLVCLVAVAHAQTPTVAFGTTHAVALRNNGDVLTWGNNVFCQLGRRSPSNDMGLPTLMMRNVKEIAVAVTHSFALTTDGKLYGWGESPYGLLGFGDDKERCEGPELVPSLADKSIAHVSTGYYHAVALTTDGNLYCAGENDMGQCPVGRADRSVTFAPLPFPELAGKVAAVKAGMFHTLVQTKDGKLFVFGRGRDGQLANGRAVNGAGFVPDMTEVVSFAAGTWHNVVARADGSVWAWGNDSKSQLCDGATTNRLAPARVALPAGVKIVEVLAGGLSTILRSADGALYACGDNQSGLLGLDKDVVVAQPTVIPVPAARTLAASMGGAHTAISPDGCGVRLAGAWDNAIISGSPTPAATNRMFTARANLTLCGTRPQAPLATLVFEWPKGGQSGCWTPRGGDSADVQRRYGGQRAAMLVVEEILKKNAAFLAPPKVSRFRSAIAAGPSDESGARIHVKVVPERKDDLTRLWTGVCDVIPQLDRIGGQIEQVSVFINNSAHAEFFGQGGDVPKLTGRVAGFPEYGNRVLITKDGRLPWIPQTLADRLDIVGRKRDEALADWAKSRADQKAPDPAAAQQAYEMLKKSDPAGAEKYLQTTKDIAAELARQQRDVVPARTAMLRKQIADYQRYRASFTADQLNAPAVLGDPSGQQKREFDGRIAALRQLTSDEQKQVDEWASASRALERQAQAERANPDAATKLRTQANELAQNIRTLRARQQERVLPEIEDLTGQCELVNLKPGASEQAIAVKPNPSLPDFKEPNRIQVITVLFTVDPDPRSPQHAWQQQIKDTFDYAALAALLK